jgi:CBS domain-containing protein
MSIEQELQQEQVSQLDLSNFVLIEIGTAVKDAVKQMREKNQTCAIITDQEDLVGIFTDHDIMVKIADDPETWNLPIDDFVTPSPLTVQANDPVSKALALMEDRRFRNVPVLGDDSQVVGNLTHYAMIKYLADRFPQSVYNQPPVPDRNPRKRNGA